MRKLLLSMALISNVISEELETKKHRPLLPESGLQFWLPTDTRSPWDIKDKEGSLHQQSKSSRRRISESRDLNRFLFNNPNLHNTTEDSQASNNHQNLNKPSGIDKNKPTFLQLPFDQFELSTMNLNQERFKCTYDRCLRQQGWRVQAPHYVEEPNWVQIESESFETPVIRSEPFFVNRGKRSLKLKVLNPHKNMIQKIEIQKADTSKENIHKPKERKKREISPKVFQKILKMKHIQKRSEADDQKWLKSIEKTLKGGENTGVMLKSSSYLNPRNKHSDILEIFEEPFFISRGKKNDFFTLRDYSLEDLYPNRDLESLILDMDEDAMLSKLELDTKHKILDKILNNEARRKKSRDKNKNKIQSNAKRGVLEELNLQLDPFYVARG